MHVDEFGRLEIVDPGFDTLELLRFIDPSYGVRSEPLPSFEGPRIGKALTIRSGVSIRELEAQEDSCLWKMHDRAIDHLPFTLPVSLDSGEASLIDLKTELARRTLRSCRLCRRGCGTNRLKGEQGVCGLGTEAKVHEHFVHISEEPQVNPSLNVYLAGCGLQCVFCQQSHLLEPSQVEGEALDHGLWGEFEREGARAMSFIGGNPDESIYGILRFLSGLPEGWNLPVVWNCNGYGTKESVKLLEGIIDAYVPDLKFGCPGCGDELANASDYWDNAREVIPLMLGQGVPVIVRMLVLPGHSSCCHKPGLEFLKEIDGQGTLFVCIRDQYSPDWAEGDEGKTCMARKTYPEEALELIEYAGNLGLRLII